jgi:hypothetical protein
MVDTYGAVFILINLKVADLGLCSRWQAVVASAADGTGSTQQIRTSNLVEHIRRGIPKRQRFGSFHASVGMLFARHRKYGTMARSYRH